MAHFDPGALLARSYALPRGPRVRLRLPSPLDSEQIRDLYARSDEELTDLELARLLRSDLRSFVAICASALIDGRDTLIGIGSINISEDDGVEYARVIVDHHHTDGLDELLCQALSGRAAAIAAGRAA